MNILFSLIIPVYNSKRTIVNCLKSVIINDYPKCEIIIIDDKSDDGTLKKILSFKKKIKKIL